MSKVRAAGWLALGFATIVFAGCDKKVTLTFVNETPDIRPVAVNLPGDPPFEVGTLSGVGSRVRTTLKINKKALPIDVQWTAGNLQGTVPIDEDTEKKLLIPVGTSGVGPIDKHTEVETHKQTETTAEETHEVVE